MDNGLDIDIGFNSDQAPQDLSIANLTQEQADQLLNELQALEHKSPLDYVPHPPNPLTGFPGMKEFHCSLKKERLIFGGNQSGKTVSGANEALFHATGLYPSWYPKESRYSRPTRGRIVGEDYKKWCGETLEPKLMDWLPKELIVNRRNTMQGILEKLWIRHTSGGTSTIDIMTHEQDMGLFESWTGDWIWFDEPPPMDIYSACTRGLLAQDGRAWFTFTPIKEPWLHQRFVLDKTDYVYLLYVDISDNPYLTKEKIAWFTSTLTEDEKDARLHGKSKFLSGRVYKEFDPKIHVLSKDKIKLSKSWPVYFVCDPHDRDKQKAIWARVDPFNTIYVFDEILLKADLKTFSKAVLAKELMNGINPNTVIRIGDPNKLPTPSAQTGLTFKQMFADNGLYFIDNVNDDVTLGHLAVAQRLHWDKDKPISPTNLPKLYFIEETTPQCTKEMSMYVWDEWMGASKDSKGMKETPKGVNKCMPDCVRYLVMVNPSFFEADESNTSAGKEPEEKTKFSKEDFPSRKGTGYRHGS